MLIFDIWGIWPLRNSLLRRAEEEAARQAAIDAGEAEPEAVEPPEEHNGSPLWTLRIPKHQPKPATNH